MATARRERLTVDEIKLESGERTRFTIARRPRLTGLDRRSFHLADGDHLPCVRFGQFAPADETAAFADGSEIVANVVLRFLHFNCRQSSIVSGL
jgi:hypothetical protein